ncbi:MAG: ACT domain-containing protein [Nitrososphaerota archaeon]|jgi:aspartate kinase|nr:ACT domain-containing protein [Nitrososphaerota archaeon]
MRVVIKFGGVSLGTGEKVRVAAQAVRDAEFEEKVVVVSAPGRTTDQLLDLVSSFEEKIDEREYAEILSMGERTSVKVFSSALRALGIPVATLDPADPDFPIVTDENHLNAVVDMESTRKAVQKKILPLLGKSVVVVPGFVGRCSQGVTVLGRGGSDITATVLGSCLDAGQVILVKETAGVMSADPKVVNNAHSVDTISIGEMYALAHGGAKVVRPEALFYKSPSQRLRVVQFGTRLDEGGTEVTGYMDPDRPAFATERSLQELTIVTEGGGNVLPEVTKILEKNLVGIGTASTSTTFFFRGPDWKDVCIKVHGMAGVKAVSGRGGVGCISLIHPRLVDQPGIVAKAATILSLNGINIYEVTSSKGSMSLFIEDGVVDTALRLLEESVKVG